MIWNNEKTYDTIIDGMALGYGVPAPLIKGIIAKESGFNPKAYKAEPHIGDASRGLMQVLNRTAKALGFTGHVDELYEPSKNILYGAKLLKENLQRSKNNVGIAVAAYNAGWSKVRKGDAPRDTKGSFVNQQYVDDVKVYTSYFAGQLEEKEVRSYQRSKLFPDGKILFF